MGQELSEKVAIVTGGASGLGRATVERFVEEGAAVVIADVDGARGAAARHGGRIQTHRRRQRGSRLGPHRLRGCALRRSARSVQQRRNRGGDRSRYSSPACTCRAVTAPSPAAGSGDAADGRADARAGRLGHENRHARDFGRLLDAGGDVHRKPLTPPRDNRSPRSDRHRDHVAPSPAARGARRDERYVRWIDHPCDHVLHKHERQ
jgi:hypothetical protein